MPICPLTLSGSVPCVAGTTQTSLQQPIDLEDTWVCLKSKFRNNHLLFKAKGNKRRS